MARTSTPSTGSPRRTPAVVLVASSLALVAVVTSGLWLCSRESVSTANGEATAMPTIASGSPSTVWKAPSLLSPSADRLRPERTLVLAQSHALEWNKDAVLIAFEAVGVKSGIVDTTRDGRVSARFGKPSASRVGAGAPVSAKQLVISIANGAASITGNQGAPTVGVAPPRCTFDAAVKMAVASGVPANATLELRYTFEPLRGAPIWRVSVPGAPQLDRNMDADSCAIILRL